MKVAVSKESSFCQISKMITALCILRMWRFCVFLYSFTLFVVECLLTERKGWVLNGHRASVVDGQKPLGNKWKNDFQYKSAQPAHFSRPLTRSVYLQQSVNRKTWTSSAVSEAVLLSFSCLKPSSWYSIIHGFHGSLIRYSIFRSAA